MLETALVLAPDFALVALGVVLGRWVFREHGFWKGVEKLVYYVLFPPMLFRSIVNAELTVGDSVEYLAVATGTMLAVVALSFASRFVVSASRLDHASVFQCPFRFNSYIGFSVVLSLYGDTGLALMSLFIAFWVPISSVLAVTELARATARNRSVLAEILRNPLIIATLAGLTAHACGVTLAKPVDVLFARLGTSSLVLGLVAIGVSLKLSDLRSYKALLAEQVVLRIVVVPVLAIAAVLFAGLPEVPAMAFVIFATLPTANSCYILAVNMGGNGSLVAAVMTLQTVLSAATIPFFIHLAQSLI